MALTYDVIRPAKQNGAAVLWIQSGGWYTAIGRELGAAVVPVGLAWQSFLRGHERPVLHDRDQSHPTPAGSYLAACAFPALLLGENPVGIGGDVPGLDESEWTALQRAAWQACRPASTGRGQDLTRPAAPGTSPRSVTV